MLEGMISIRRLAFLAATLGLAAATAVAEPQSYIIQSDAQGATARMELNVHKTGIYSGKTHVFLFPVYRGSVTYDPQQPSASRVELVLDARSIHCVDTWVNEGELRDIQKEAEEKMLAVDRYPEIRFVSSSVSRVQDGRYRVQGTLTIRDRGEPSTVAVTMEPNPDGSLAFSGDAIVKLKDYGLKPPSKFFGVVATKNEMDFRFSLTATPGS